MRLLLDTHVFLWWREASPRIGREPRAAIERAERVLVSAASAWEAAVKSALGKLRLPGSFAAAVAGSDMEELPITFEHAARAGELPAHHADPFDRMLVAQAQGEGLVIVTHDRSFEPYQVTVLWV